MILYRMSDRLMVSFMILQHQPHYHDHLYRIPTYETIIEHVYE